MIFIPSVNTLHVTKRLLLVSKPLPSKPSAVLLSVAGQTQTRYSKYIGYSLKESAWQHTRICFIPEVLPEELQGSLADTFWQASSFLLKAQRRSATLNNDTTMKTQIGSQNSSL